MSTAEGVTICHVFNSLEFEEYNKCKPNRVHFDTIKSRGVTGAAAPVGWGSEQRSASVGRGSALMKKVLPHNLVNHYNQPISKKSCLVINPETSSG